MTLAQGDHFFVTHIPNDENAAQRLLRAIVRAAGGQVEVNGRWLLEDEGVLLRYDVPNRDAYVFRLSCVDGHTPDDPAPGRAVCCRMCGGVVKEGRF